MRVAKHHEIVMKVSPDDAWRIVQDIPSLVECLPGARITGPNGPGGFDGEITVKVGPVATTFHGTVTVEKVDAGARALTLSGRGRDRSGQSQSAISLTVQVRSEADAASVVCGDAQIDVTGRLASIGGRMIPAVADVIISDFTTRLRAKLEPATAQSGGSAETVHTSEGPPQSPASTLNGGALIWKALWNWLVNLFHRDASAGPSERQ